MSFHTGYRQLSSDRGYRHVSSDRGYRQLSSDRGYRQLSSDRGYRQLSNDRGEHYEYNNSNAALYAYDNPASANHDVIGDGSPVFARNQFRCSGGRNPTFVLDSAESFYLHQQQTNTSLSFPYTRRDYSNYFLQDTSYAAEALKRPTTLEVHFCLAWNIINYTIIHKTVEFFF